MFIGDVYHNLRSEVPAAEMLLSAPAVVAIQQEMQQRI